MTRVRTRVAVVVALLVVAAGSFVVLGRSVWNPLYVKITGGRTVAAAVSQYGDAARGRLGPAFAEAKTTYPSSRVALLGLKSERVLELWADDGGGWRFVKRYPVLAASGKTGPKLREGDRQVPEGVYRIAALNPNSSYHLSMQIDYPNAFDLQQATSEGRTNPGGEIFIHGSNVSIGCLAIGDEAIEELFVLVSDVGKGNVTVLLAPSDPRVEPLPRTLPNAPVWLPALYDRIEKEFAAFPGT